MSLQFLFEEPILEQLELSPGYDDHASDVWLVTTVTENVVVRTTRMIEEPNNDFWSGCKRLFGIDPRNVHELESINNKLLCYSSIAIPRVIRKGLNNKKQYVVVERLEGEVCRSFNNQTDSILNSLGDGIGSIHQYRTNYIGNASGIFKTPLEDFHTNLIKVMRELVGRYYSEHPSIKELLPSMISLVQDLPTPSCSTFVLIDMDPSQFLTNGYEITALVDSEAYVLAPREFDFIGLEYLMDEHSAQMFKGAYQKRLSIPDLGQCRLPYRYFYRLLRVQGSVDLDEWLNHPVRF